MILSFRLVFIPSRHYYAYFEWENAATLIEKLQIACRLIFIHEIHDFSLVIQFIAIYLHNIENIQFKFK